MNNRQSNIFTEVNLRKNFEYIIKDDQLQFKCLPSQEEQNFLVKLDLQNQFFWHIEKNKLISFSCTDTTSTKLTFSGEESDLLNLKQQLSNRVMFGNVKKIYGDAIQIGEGGSSQVFSVGNLLKSKPFDQKLAVKVIDKAQLDSQGVIGRQGFFIEICNMRKLDHPNIIKLHEVYEGEQKYYMVLDYLSGGSLTDLLLKHQQKQSYISYDKIKSILKQIIQGLLYLHETADMMHRDLKPENILFLDERQTEVKIVDFGLATECSVEQYHYSRCGTPGYIAPCIANYNENKKKYTKQCDIFSLGAILFKMITFRELFGGQTPYQVLKENQACKMNLAALALLGIPIDAQNLLKRMLDVNPQTRITAREILDHQFLQDRWPIILQPHQRKSLFQNLKFHQGQYSFRKDQKCSYKDDLILSRCNPEIINDLLPSLIRNFNYQINNVGKQSQLFIENSPSQYFEQNQSKPIFSMFDNERNLLSSSGQNAKIHLIEINPYVNEAQRKQVKN